MMAASYAHENTRPLAPVCLSSIFSLIYFHYIDISPSSDFIYILYWYIYETYISYSLHVTIYSSASLLFFFLFLSLFLPDIFIWCLYISLICYRVTSFLHFIYICSIYILHAIKEGFHFHFLHIPSLHCFYLSFSSDTTDKATLTRSSLHTAWHTC